VLAARDGHGFEARVNVERSQDVADVIADGLDA
jgi:hypothetical protein